jgi:hypothetical protein
VIQTGAVPTISIGEALTLFGRRPESGVGFGVARDGIDGVDDGVASKTRSIPREGAHGDHPQRKTLLDSRIVAIAGTCVAKSGDELSHLRGKLVGAVSTGEFKVVFDYMGTARWGLATLAPGSTPKFKIDTWSLQSNEPKAAFAVQLKFADPFLYGDTRDFIPGRDAYHSGNVDAWPVQVVVGGAPSGYTILGPNNRQFIVTTALNEGHPHRIDFADGRLTIDGIRSSGGVDRMEVWPVPAGADVAQSLVVPAGYANLTTFVTDTAV